MTDPRGIASSGDHEELPAGMWWACHHPEKPWDDWIAYQDGCKKCWLKGTADLKIMPEETAEPGYEQNIVHMAVSTLEDWLNKQAEGYGYT